MKNQEDTSVSPEEAAQNEYDAKMAAMRETLSNVRHEIFTVREHGDEEMRIAQDLLGTVISIIERQLI